MVFVRRELPLTGLGSLAPHNLTEGFPSLPARALTRSTQLGVWGCKGFDREHGSCLARHATQ